MSFSHPLWLLGLLLWLVVPVLDRLAKPRPDVALPLTHLGLRGLRRLPASLPWLSAHGLAVMLIVLGLAGPVWQWSGGTRAEPGVAVVAVPGPSPWAWETGGRHYATLIDRLRHRSALAIAAYPGVPRLLVPWTERAEVLAGLWPRTTVPVTGADAAKAALMASAKAPAGSWLVVVGGRAGGPGWRAVGASLERRGQKLAIIQESPADLPFQPAFSASLHDPDAVAALDYQLLSITRDAAGEPEAVPLGQWCVLAAVAVLVLNWGWRYGRWQVVSP
jgi:hypothetical protein